MSDTEQVRIAGGPAIVVRRRTFGTDLASSRLTMLMVVPAEDSWSRGGRNIACLVVASNGAPLSGSVLATGR